MIIISCLHTVTLFQESLSDKSNFHSFKYSDIMPIIFKKIYLTHWRSLTRWMVLGVKAKRDNSTLPRIPELASHYGIWFSHVQVTHYFWGKRCLTYLQEIQSTYSWLSRLGAYKEGWFFCSWIDPKFNQSNGLLTYIWDSFSRIIYFQVKYLYQKLCFRYCTLLLYQLLYFM